VRLSLVLDNLETARILAERAEATGREFEVLIEIDSDGHRSGVPADADELVAIGHFLERAGIEVKAC